MKDIQEIFQRIQESKKKQKEIKQMYKDMLDQTPGYKDLVEQAQIIREKKKTVEIAVRQGMSSEIIQLDDIKVDIESDMVMMSDVALSKLLKGETVKVSDEYENEYEPIFSVKFKKTN
ncbi:hypothetical protein KJ641_01695 [Patescibacteria group bacterium]|nr:hypothetical protein [Patescibacteria group bacterium]MBU1895564.1 hypothetical protein [Patescibacteria group bacterium]